MDEEVVVSVAAVAHAQAAGFRPPGACHAVPAWALGQVQAAARGRVAAKWLARGPGVVLRVLVPGRALLAAELRKAAPGPEAACQDKALALGSALAEQAGILPAAVRRLANSAISSTCLVPQLGQSGPAARDVPAAQRLIFSSRALYRSSRLVVQLWAGGSHRSFRLAAPIGQSLAADKLVLATVPLTRSRAVAAPARTSGGPDLPT